MMANAISGWRAKRRERQRRTALLLDIQRPDYGRHCDHLIAANVARSEALLERFQEFAEANQMGTILTRTCPLATAPAPFASLSDRAGRGRTELSFSRACLRRLTPRRPSGWPESRSVIVRPMRAGRRRMPRERPAWLLSMPACRPNRQPSRRPQNERARSDYPGGRGWLSPEEIDPVGYWHHQLASAITENARLLEEEFATELSRGHTGAGSCVEYVRKGLIARLDLDLHRYGLRVQRRRGLRPQPSLRHHEHLSSSPHSRATSLLTPSRGASARP